MSEPQPKPKWYPGLAPALSAFHVATKAPPAAPAG